MKYYWFIIKFTFKIPSLFIWWLKNVLLDIAEYERQLNQIRAMNLEKHDVKKECIYCGTEWKEVIKGRVYNKYSICDLCNKRTYHEEDLIEQLTSKERR